MVHQSLCRGLWPPLPSNPTLWSPSQAAPPTAAILDTDHGLQGWALSPHTHAGTGQDSLRGGLPVSPHTWAW